MSNYTIPPRLKPSDYAKGKISQDEIIALQIANDANISKARKAFFAGEKEGAPKPIPTEGDAPDVLLADDASQEATAMSNVKKLGFRDQEASAIVTNIRNEANLNFTTLNANFPAIEDDIRKRFNTKLLTPTFFIEYLKKYSDELAGTAGMRVFNPNNSGFNDLVNNVAELRAIIPSPELIQFIIQRAISNRIGGQGVLREVERLRDMLPPRGELDAISRLPPVNQQREVQDLLTRFDNVPSTADLQQFAGAIERGEISRAEFLDRLNGLADSVPSGGGSSSSSSSSSGRRTISYDEIDDEEVIDFSDLTGETDRSGQTLRSSISIDTAPLKTIIATFEANPQLKPLLRDEITGEPVDYKKLRKEPTGRGYTGKKTYIGDTNIATIFKTTFGSGMKGAIRPNIKMKVGRGLAVKETPSYREYGKYAIHIPQLEQQDILNVKYKSLGQIPKFKPIPVSDIFRDFVLDLVENGKPNARVYTQIAPEERKFFEEMSIGAGVWNSLGLKRTTTSTDEEENKRFELLKGEYIAGNNNPKVISELRKLVVKMMSDGRIRKNQGVELLMELSI
jgi:hypothetical protein